MAYYLSTDRITLKNDNPELISKKYDNGYVFTRLAKGIMDQTRSLRIDLSQFDLNSENRRIIRKTEGLSLTLHSLPLQDYSWEIHKMGKEFYSQKFGDGTMSASKIKELFQDENKSNMNNVFQYSFDSEAIGYCLSYINSEIVHYSYPFYNLKSLIVNENPNIGLGMMLRAIVWAQENNKNYIYLGSIVDPSSKYKLQFNGLEWFDTHNLEWSHDIDAVKQLVQK